MSAPCPAHSKNDPAAAGRLRKELVQGLEALETASGSKVRLWMMNEARFGPHTEVHRLWALKGSRPVITQQIKYLWDYLYGSLGIRSGHAHFAHMSSVIQERDRVTSQS